MGYSVILFDGVCNLCNAAVDFVIERDPAGRFRFAALQSDAGRRLQRDYGLGSIDAKSVLLIDSGRVFARSTAALRIASRLGPPWSLMTVFLLVPVPVRDWLYGFVARRRYRWFGRRSTCRLPSPDELARFLD